MQRLRGRSASSAPDAGWLPSSGRRWERTGSVSRKVATLKVIDERLRLPDISAQSGCFYPQCASSGVTASDRVLAFDQSELAGHLAQLSAQDSDELDSLSNLPPIHRVIMPHTGYLSECFWR